MTYCSNCGANIELGTLYCSNCGLRAEIPVQKSSPPKKYVEVPRYASNYDRVHRSHGPIHHGHVRKSKAGKIMAIVLIVLIVASGVSLLTSSHQCDIQEDRSYTYAPDVIPAELGFSFDVSSAEVVFQFNSTPMEEIIMIDAQFDFSFRGSEDSILEEVYDIMWDTSETSVLFGVYQTDWFNWAMWDQSIIIVTLRTDVVYDLDIDTGSGSVSVDVPKGVDFTHLGINSGSGSIHLKMNGSSSIANDLSIDVGSGGIQASIKDTVIQNGFYADTGSGSLYLALDGVNLSSGLDLNTGSGNIDLSIVHSLLSNGIVSDTGSGTVSFELINTTLGGDFDVDIGSGGFNLYSKDITLLRNINWDFDGASGSINIDIQQHHSLGGLITGNIETGSGRIIVNLDMNSTIVPSNWDCDVGSGDISFDLENSVGYYYGDEILTSQSFDGTSGFNLYLDTGSGGISIYS